MNTARPASDAFKQIGEGADQPPVGGDIDGDDVVPFRRRHVIERRQRAENAGIADQNVETAVAFAQRGGEAVDTGVILQVERHQRRGAAAGADGVVEFFKPADGARHRHDMRAGCRQRQRAWHVRCRAMRR